MFPHFLDFRKRGLVIAELFCAVQERLLHMLVAGDVREDAQLDLGVVGIHQCLTLPMPTLKRIAATLQSERYNKFIFNIEGHTSDEHFSSAQYPSNWELSSARAASVARFLESRGINRVRLRTAGLYDVSPKYPNRDPFGEPIPQNRIKNRRVVIHVEPSYR